MRKRRPVNIFVRVMFFFLIAGILYFAVFVPLSRVNGVLG